MAEIKEPLLADIRMESLAELLGLDVLEAQELKERDANFYPLLDALKMMVVTHQTHEQVPALGTRLRERYDDQQYARTNAVELLKKHGVV